MAGDNLLEIRQLTVKVDGKEILHGIDLSIKTGETHVMFGPNGGGKTTLLMAIMGFPRYRVTRGSITFGGRDITKLTLDERARLGIGISFQRPPVVRGVKTRDMVTACFREGQGEEAVSQLAEKTNLTDFLDRDINYWRRYTRYAGGRAVGSSSPTPAISWTMLMPAPAMLCVMAE
ncbi:Vegetative protein 296 [subsurface metagenome]